MLEREVQERFEGFLERQYASLKKHEPEVYRVIEEYPENTVEIKAKYEERGLDSTVALARKYILWELEKCKHKTVTAFLESLEDYGMPKEVEIYRVFEEQLPRMVAEHELEFALEYKEQYHLLILSAARKMLAHNFKC